MKRLPSTLMAVLILTLLMPQTVPAETIPDIDYLSLGDCLAAGQPYDWYTERPWKLDGYGCSADRLMEEGRLHQSRSQRLYNKRHLYANAANGIRIGRSRDHHTEHQYQ